MNANSRTMVIAALLVVMGAAAPPAASAREPDPDSTVAEMIERFRSEWTATEEHMRPLEDGGWKSRMEILSGLARLGEVAVPGLIRALENPEPDVRVLAAQALSYLADPRAEEPLRKTLAQDDEAAARLYAADALGAIGGLQPSLLLENVEGQDANRDVRSHLGFALERDGKPLDEAVRAALRSFDVHRIDSARVGEPAPDFTLIDALGTSYRLADFRDNQAVVLVFIYGDT